MSPSNAMINRLPTAAKRTFHMRHNQHIDALNSVSVMPGSERQKAATIYWKSFLMRIHFWNGLIDVEIYIIGNHRVCTPFHPSVIYSVTIVFGGIGQVNERAGEQAFEQSNAQTRRTPIVVGICLKFTFCVKLVNFEERFTKKSQV